MNRKLTGHNLKIRVLLFFVKPLHVFNVLLFVKMWKLMSYGPSTFKNFFNGTASHVTQALWREEFSPFLWYFLIAAALDMAVVEYLPLIRKD